MPYLIRRWREGRTDGRQLWREMQAQGYVHSARTVCRFMTRLRRAAEAGQAPESRRPRRTPARRAIRPAVSFVMGVS